MKKIRVRISQKKKLPTQFKLQLQEQAEKFLKNMSTHKAKPRTYKNICCKFKYISCKNHIKHFFGLTGRRSFCRSCYGEIPASGRSRFVLILVPTYVCNERIKLNSVICHDT